MQVSVGALFLGGALPGLMIGLALMATVYGFAKIRHYPVTATPNWTEFWAAWKGAALALLTPIFVIGGIVGGIDRLFGERPESPSRNPPHRNADK